MDLIFACNTLEIPTIQQTLQVQQLAEINFISYIKVACSFKMCKMCVYSLLQFLPLLMWCCMQYDVIFYHRILSQLMSVLNVIINSLRTSDAILQHRSGSTLAQVMACCLTVPSHYLNQCWLIISNVLWHSSEGNFIRDTSATIYYN